MTREPSAKAVSFHRLAAAYGAPDFEDCLANYVVRFNNPDASPATIRNLTKTFRLGFEKVPVYHKARFWEVDFPRYRHASDEYDVIHATPARQDKRGNIIPGRFDSGLVNTGAGGPLGVTGALSARRDSDKCSSLILV